MQRWVVATDTGEIAMKSQQSNDVCPQSAGNWTYMNENGVKIFSHLHL